MTDGVFSLYKEEGETPLERIERFRATRPNLKGLRSTYAGRLDPLAEGVLIMLAGDARFDKESFTALEKEYSFEVLFGFATDTYDVLGMVTQTVEMKPSLSDIQNILPTFLGEQEHYYPPFSSKEIGGTALHTKARNRDLSDEDVPSRRVTIHALQCVGIRTLSQEELYDNIRGRVEKVHGDFRQEHICSKWHKYLSKAGTKECTLAQFNLHCSSGTYVRRVAHEMGKRLNGAALAFHIMRTRVGEYHLEDAIR